MPEEMTSQDLKERIALIETMIAEGRKQTQSWGWTFLLWGVAYYIAMAWTAWGTRPALAWPVTMIAASIVTALSAARMAHSHPTTTLGRATGSVWLAVGISMFILLFALAWQRLLDQQIFMGIVAAMLGTANAASSLILKWKAQFVCTVVWWITCAVCVVGTPRQSMLALVVAILICQIAFGIYAMSLDARRRRPNGAVHA